MAPTTTDDVHRITFDIDWPPGTAHAHLLTADEPVLVDAGAPGDAGWERLRAGLAAAGTTPAELAHVLVTHPHTDHDGQVARLAEAGDPTVYALAAARDRLARDPDELAAAVRGNAREAGLGPAGVDEHVRQAVASLERNRSCLPPEAVDVALDPGERFEAGGVAFETVHTPGHQRDHACFLASLDPGADDVRPAAERAGGDASATRSLFAGDMVIETFRAAALDVGLDAGTYGSIERFYEGYERLRGRAVDRVYPGHGPVFDDFADAVERSVASLDDLVADAAAALAAWEPATAHEVARARSDDVDPRDYVLYETVGALGALESLGEVRSTLVDGVRRFETVETG